MWLEISCALPLRSSVSRAVAPRARFLYEFLHEHAQSSAYTRFTGVLDSVLYGVRVERYKLL